ncbi:hypothetical protein H696_05956 [Fonticula alba]|uniref:Uncharacterized protein n=1 Tax=Fonticula alba TaxID=691883 RepID=A0A058Z082_FONAL|nr:hypothetical protein H696_05956 [Fonticula alba]KCV67660.1 hypothetical protein H696_05956 [Fonticula alba]|eukprot:XP_009497998.1 hypothetical protein H696_05956 [Fonticula alba]
MSRAPSSSAAARGTGPSVHQVTSDSETASGSEAASDLDVVSGLVTASGSELQLMRRGLLTRTGEVIFLPANMLQHGLMALLRVLARLRESLSLSVDVLLRVLLRTGPAADGAACQAEAPAAKAPAAKAPAPAPQPPGPVTQRSLIDALVALPHEVGQWLVQLARWLWSGSASPESPLAGPMPPARAAAGAAARNAGPAGDCPSVLAPGRAVGTAAGGCTPARAADTKTGRPAGVQVSLP